MRKAVIALCLLTVSAQAAGKAKNVILFLADGTGIPTLSAASINGYGEPQKLYVQHLPYLGLSDTSSASSWVTDSAAGMTAIVTGRKTNNGVLSQAPAQRGATEGEALKTILEYAEEHGLSTGVVSNSPMWDATPAACYSHVSSRTKTGEIFLQVLKPRFGDGVDLVLGPGRAAILKETAALGVNLAQALPEKGYTFLDSPEALDKLDPKTRRVVALWEANDADPADKDFDLTRVVNTAIRILSQNPKGFFLMVESNNHFPSAQKSLERAVKFDRLIAATGEKWKRDSLILFTADHSYDLRLPKGARGEGIVPQVKVTDTHTGEEVLVGAEGPGAELVRGMFPNTRLFEIMMAAYGWK